MSEKKLTNRTAEISDNIRDNTLRAVDEIAKVQPQMSLSVSNLQHDTIETTKNAVKTAFDTQKQIASGLNVSVPPQVSEQITRQSNELTNNFVSAAGIYNGVVFSALNAARENAKIYTDTVNALTEYNTNILNAWASFWAAQRNQFTRA